MRSRPKNGPVYCNKMFPLWQPQPAAQVPAMNPQTQPTGQRLFGAYYGATALFFVLDYVFGLNIRVSFLAELPVWRLAWYLFCGACLFAIWRFPRWTNSIAAFESLMNLAALILHMGSRVMVPSAAIMDGGPPPVTAREVINFLISGTAAYAALWLRTRKVRQRPQY